MVILYKVFPPVVFVMSILFNQIAIRYFNHLMSHTEYVPIVNTKGDVIGRSLAIEALNYKNAYINPVIRIAVSTHGMLFLCDRPMNAILDKGKTDIPMECYLRYGESLTEGVNRLVHNALPHATEDFKPSLTLSITSRMKQPTGSSIFSSSISKMILSFALPASRTVSYGVSSR